MRKIVLVICTVLFVSSVNAESLQDVKERMQYDSITVEEKGFSHTNKDENSRFYFDTIVEGNNSHTDFKVRNEKLWEHKDILNKSDNYAEIKQGEPYKERFEAMAGMPSKEKLFVDYGADLVKVDYDYIIEQTRKQENYVTLYDGTY